MIKLNYKKAVLVHAAGMFFVIAAVFSVMFFFQQKRVMGFILHNAESHLSEIAYVVARDIERNDGPVGLAYMDRQAAADDAVDSLTITEKGRVVLSTDRDLFIGHPLNLSGDRLVLSRNFSASSGGLLADYQLIALLDSDYIKTVQGNAAFESVKYSLAVTFVLLAVQLFSIYIIYRNTFSRFFKNMLKNDFDQTYSVEEIQTLNNAFRKTVEELNTAKENLNSKIEELSTQKHLFQTLFDSIPLPVYYKNREGVFLECNRAFWETVMVSDKKSIIGRTAEEIIGKEAASDFEKMDDEIYENPVVLLKYEKKLSAPIFSEPRDLIFYKTAVLNNRNEADGLISIAIDVTEKRYQENLQMIQMKVAESFMLEDENQIFNSINEVLLKYFDAEFGLAGYIDSKGCLRCPSMSTEIFEKCRMDGKSNVFPQSVWGGIWGRCIKEKRIIFQNSGLNVPSGHIGLFNAMAVPVISGTESIGEFVVANRKGGFKERDANAAAHIATIIAPMLKHWHRNKQHEENLMSEKQALEIAVQQETAIKHRQEQMLFEQKKFADMGQMMSAIAHQWRQPLNALGIVIQNISDEYRDKSLTEETVEDFEQNGLRLVAHMSETIDHFRNFFSPDKEMEAFEAILETISLLKLINVQIESKNIKLEIACRCSETETACQKLADFPGCGFGATKIYGYPGEFKQSVINIIYNSVDAIKAAEESGKIQRGVIRLTFKSENNTLTIRISDNGGGIPENILGSVFDPYFTTKQEGKGTGIGLYMTKMIVEEHMKGRLTVENENEGAAFTITLPLCAAI